MLISVTVGGPYWMALNASIVHFFCIVNKIYLLEDMENKVFFMQVSRTFHANFMFISFLFGKIPIRYQQNLISIYCIWEKYLLMMPAANVIITFLELFIYEKFSLFITAKFFSLKEPKLIIVTLRAWDFPFPRFFSNSAKNKTRIFDKRA